MAMSPGTTFITRKTTRAAPSRVGIISRMRWTMYCHTGSDPPSTGHLPHPSLPLDGGGSGRGDPTLKHPPQPFPGEGSQLTSTPIQILKPPIHPVARLGLVVAERAVRTSQPCPPKPLDAPDFLQKPFLHLLDHFDALLFVHFFGLAAKSGSTTGSLSAAPVLRPPGDKFVASSHRGPPQSQSRRGSTMSSKSRLTRG